MNLTRWIGSFWLLLITALPAIAQQAPAIGPADEPPKRWLGAVIAIVLLVGIAVASFMSPKRSHLD